MNAFSVDFILTNYAHTHDQYKPLSRQKDKLNMKIDASTRPPSYRRPDFYDLTGDDYSVSLGFVLSFLLQPLIKPSLKMYL